MLRNVPLATADGNFVNRAPDFFAITFFSRPRCEEVSVPTARDAPAGGGALARSFSAPPEQPHGCP
jgi:hypothetical protein